MKTIKHPIIATVTVLAAAVVILLLAFLLTWQPRGPWDITIATGTKGGTYYPLGQQFARVLEKLPEIEKAVSLETAASIENMQLLGDSKADLALVFRPAIATMSEADRDKLSVLARLYTDVVQIVVRKGAGIHSLMELNAKKVHVGREGSGTKVVAEAILDALQISPSQRIDEGGYDQASQKLMDGEIDAVFFASGKPRAVKVALESGDCYLLDLGDNLDKIITSIPDLAPEEIPANFYANQAASIQTVGADALLMCRKDLDQDLVYLIVNALFNNIGDLLMAHTRAHSIRLDNAFDGLPESVELHPGAVRFLDRVRKELLIVTGAFNGKYHELGKTIQLLLNQRGIDARVIHTDGSLENVWLLTQRPTLAIIQYDVALASYWGAPELLYKEENIADEVNITHVRNMRRIATFHPERVHIMMRRDRLPEGQSEQPSIQALRDVRVCLGPKNSGTRMLAQAILAHHGLVLKSPTVLSVPDMVDRIHNGEIDAGFFVSAVPSGAVKTVLDNEQLRLLSIEPKKITKLIGLAIKVAKIDPGTYTCQLEGEPAIETLETRAVLVTTENLPFNVQTITKAVFEGTAFLGIEVDDLAKDIPSIPLHSGAQKYYQKAGHLPSKPPFDWLAATWRSLACIMILIGGYRGFIHWGREKTAKQNRRRIYDVPVETSELISVVKLRRIRSDIRRSIRRSWRWGRLDESRRRELENLIADRIREAQENLAAASLAKIRAVGKESNLDRETQLEHYSSLEEQVWMFRENGELDVSQHEFLIKVLADQRQSMSS